MSTIDIRGQIDNDINKRLRKATRVGRPAGSDEFHMKVANLTGRNLRKKKPGRAKNEEKHNAP